MQFIFTATFQDKTFETGKYFIINQKDSIQLTQLRFYISNIECFTDDKTSFKEKDSYHLVDLTENKFDTIRIDLKSNQNIKLIKFNLGIDSLTNSNGVLGGDLDPTTGMYWTWQSGYINFKLEGNSNLCPTRNNSFSYHIGGYSGKTNALQTITLNTEKESNILIQFDLSKLFNSINLGTTNQIMSPKPEAVEIAKILAASFHIK